MTKRFALISFGILCLMMSALIGFHIGGQSVQAQATESIVGFSIWTGRFGGAYVMLPNGDVWENETFEGDHFGGPAVTFLGNFWTGDSTVPAESRTWGNVKGKYDRDK